MVQNPQNRILELSKRLPFHSTTPEGDAMNLMELIRGFNLGIADAKAEAEAKIVKPPPLWYIGLIFNRNTMLVQLDLLYSHEYYMLVEVLHALNGEGFPFLFISSQYSKEQNDKLMEWIFLSCGSNKDLHKRCTDELLPRLNKLCNRLRETNHDGTRFSDEDVHRGHHSEGRADDHAEELPSGEGLSLPCGGYETNPSGSD